ncbi:TPA: hypothetical protein ACPZMO_000619 [Yersinia enterocolitica]|uniref:hypothetical protein n=1 Tax=Yersinia TaxID=629 RepID=UPI0005DC987E|nr:MULTISPECIES: hypothetical protein [Yersinia]CNE87738.1 Uncharacterised protein [Yersinia mollaretii]CNF64292.1 Uncharacterised protein [Yersinia mollaretii]
MPKYKVFCEPSPHSLWNGEAENSEKAWEAYLKFSDRYKYSGFAYVIDYTYDEKSQDLNIYITECTEKDNEKEDYEIFEEIKNKNRINTTQYRKTANSR